MTLNCTKSMKNRSLETGVGIQELPRVLFHTKVLSERRPLFCNSWTPDSFFGAVQMGNSESCSGLVAKACNFYTRRDCLLPSLSSLPLTLRSGQLRLVHLAVKRFMSTEEVLNALERYTKESAETDRETATKLGVTQVLLSAWLQRAAQPEKCMLARLAGFLRRVGYI
jgi:hypothetical protein